MVVRTSILLLVAIARLSAQPNDPRSSRYPAPKMWDDAALATWGTPVTGLNVRPGYFSSPDYYRAPIDNLRTYPVYLPDREPAGYWEALRKKRPEPLIEMNRARSKAEWIVAGKRVWEELDVPILRLFDSESIALARSSEHFRDSKPHVCWFSVKWSAGALR
jgi:hypothetical protein